MSDSVTYMQPESYQESLRCYEAAEWRTARKLRLAHIERGVMRVMSTPPGKAYQVAIRIPQEV